MLIRLYGKNFRSLRDRFELSLVAADLKREADRGRGVVEVPIKGMPEPLHILCAAAIYGPNASGKSTVLTAARALNWLVTESSRRSKPDGTIPPYEPFLLDRASRRAPVELGCDIAYNDRVLRYEVTFGETAFRREVLTVLDGDGEDRLIDRKAKGAIGGRLIEGSRVNGLYVEGMQPNVSVLSKLAQHGPRDGAESVLPFYRAIARATHGADYSNAAVEWINLTNSHEARFADDPDYRAWVMDHLMRPADFGIRDVVIRREKLALPRELKERIENDLGGAEAPDSAVNVSFFHEGDAKHPILFEYESSGTKKLFNVAGDWWSLAHEGVSLFADELGASLHPRLLDRLVRAVNEVPADGPRSQLIFATHDPGLLESQDGRPAALRRDQVYFTKKDPKGATELYSLTEFKEGARSVHNIRKRYLSGLYGALPRVGELSL